MNPALASRLRQQIAELRSERARLEYRLLKRRRVEADERLRRTLGDDPQGFVEIERLVDIAGRFTCYSQLYLPAGRFLRILDVPTMEIESVNLKTLFADQFGAPTISVVCASSRRRCARICRRAERCATLVSIVRQAHVRWATSGPLSYSTRRRRRARAISWSAASTR